MGCAGCHIRDGIGCFPSASYAPSLVLLFVARLFVSQKWVPLRSQKYFGFCDGKILSRPSSPDLLKNDNIPVWWLANTYIVMSSSVSVSLSASLSLSSLSRLCRKNDVNGPSLRPRFYYDEVIDIHSDHNPTEVMKRNIQANQLS